MKQLVSAVFMLLPAMSPLWADDASSNPPEAPPAVNPLAELDWMTGEWIDAGGDVTVVTTVSWTKNHKFLTRQFQLTSEGTVTLEGTQVIGWDPARQQLRSWTFDSEGGFGEGTWSRDGNRWTVKTRFTMPDGGRASAVNVFTYVDADSFRWQSIGREINGELQPSIPEVTVVRKPAAVSAAPTSE